MKKQALVLVTILIAATTYSQCISGDCQNGFGTIKYQEATYEGTFKNGNLDGLGIMIYTDGNSYFGQFNNSKFNGYGFFQWKDGQSHFGKWENGVQNADGIYNNGKENVTAGTWEKGTFKIAENTDAQPNNPANSVGNCINGYGRITYPDGLLIQAVFKNGKATVGRILKSNQFMYDGFIANNLFNGYGQIQYANSDHYFGYFKDGKKHGEGIFSQKDKPRVYGKWENDVFIDPNAFNEETFCKELITYISTKKEGRVSQNTIAFSEQNMYIVEKKFLNRYQIQQSNNKSSKDSTIISFPIIDKSTSKVSLDMLKSALKKCKQLTYVSPDQYKFNNINLSLAVWYNLNDFALNANQLKIVYPYENLNCISGDCYNGIGKSIDHLGNIYEGNFKNGLNHGNGKMTFKSGDLYIGNFENNLRSGNGKYIKADGNIYEGNFINGAAYGKGIFIWVSGVKYEGDFVNGNQTGKGKTYDETGKLVYEGAFLNNKFDGIGTYYEADGSKYIGDFKNGEFNGKGKYYDKDGKIIEDGEFSEGLFIKKN